MSNGEIRVLVLILILLALEILRMQTLTSWFSQAWKNIGAALSGTENATPPQTKKGANA